MSGDGMRTGLEYDLEAQREYTRRLQVEKETLIADLEAARAELSAERQRNKPLRERIHTIQADADKRIAPLQAEVEAFKRLWESAYDFRVIHEGDDERIRYEKLITAASPEFAKGIVRYPMSASERARIGMCLERIEAAEAALAAERARADGLEALIVHDVGDGTLMCDICHYGPQFDVVQHAKDCPYAALDASATPGQPEAPSRPWCETCGTAVREVLCPACSDWWLRNGPGQPEAKTINVNLTNRGRGKAMPYPLDGESETPELLPGCAECGWNDEHAPQCSQYGAPAPPSYAQPDAAPLERAKNDALEVLTGLGYVVTIQRKDSQFEASQQQPGGGEG